MDRLTISKEKDLTRLAALSGNSVLKTYSEVIEAKNQLKELKLFLHHDPIKSWDTYKMINIINKARRRLAHDRALLSFLIERIAPFKL